MLWSGFVLTSSDNPLSKKGLYGIWLALGYPIYIMCSGSCQGLPNDERRRLSVVVRTPDYNGIKLHAMVTAPLLSGKNMQGRRFATAPRGPLAKVAAIGGAIHRNQG